MNQDCHDQDEPVDPVFELYWDQIGRMRDLTLPRRELAELDYFAGQMSQAKQLATLKEQNERLVHVTNELEHFVINYCEGSKQKDLRSFVQHYRDALSGTSPLPYRNDPELVKIIQSLAKWNEPDSVQGTGDYDQGLMCGVEDKGYQQDGYSAMRYGYDSALGRVSEEIDGQIAAAIKLINGGTK